MDSRDADGRWAHRYDQTVRLSKTSSEPDGPYAMYLADSKERYRLLAFDFDAKAGDVVADVAGLADLLEQAGIAPVVVASGSGASRHVWVSVPGGVDAGFVYSLAKAAGRRWPTLDTAPLTNARTGCVRPPGAPHRNGGRASILGCTERAISTLTAGVDRAAVERLAWLLGVTPEKSTADTPPAAGAVVRETAVKVDAAGYPCVPGRRRDLTSKVRSLITQPLDDAENPSNRLWRVMLGVVSLRWTYTELAALAETNRHQPGFTHIFSRAERIGDRRTPREPHAVARLLEQQWGNAVARITQWAQSQGDRSDDAEFAERDAAVGEAITAAQERADASVGRWAQGGGVSDRRVFDVLCRWMAESRQLVIEANVRRIGVECGISRETARKALNRLAADGWIYHAGGGEGRAADQWGLSTVKKTPGLSQGGLPPANLGCPYWIFTLKTRCERAGHDLFTYGWGLGHTSGSIYNATMEHQEATGEPADLHTVTAATGFRLSTVYEKLSELVDVDVLTRLGAGYIEGTSSLDRAATVVGAAGIGAARERRYRDERLLWEWWTEETARLRQKRSERARLRPRRTKPPGQGQIAMVVPGLPVWARFDRFPRRHHGRPDHQRARELIRTAHTPQRVAT